jgi:hypothetical protein
MNMDDGTQNSASNAQMRDEDAIEGPAGHINQSNIQEDGKSNGGMEIDQDATSVPDSGINQ